MFLQFQVRRPQVPSKTPCLMPSLLTVPRLQIQQERGIGVNGARATEKPNRCSIVPFRTKSNHKRTSKQSDCSFPVRSRTCAVRSCTFAIRERTCAVRSCTFAVRERTCAVRSRTWTVRSCTFAVRERTFAVRSRTRTVRSCSFAVRSRTRTVRSCSFTVRSCTRTVRSCFWWQDGCEFPLARCSTPPLAPPLIPILADLLRVEGELRTARQIRISFDHRALAPRLR